MWKHFFRRAHSRLISMAYTLDLLNLPGKKRPEAVFLVVCDPPMNEL
jgi:hypothetical protein